MKIFRIFANGIRRRKEKEMCQTNVISQRIGRIGRRSFDRRMRMASPLFVEKEGEMQRLLNDVDRLSERLHKDFPTISPEDYNMFGPELKIVISTLKDLRRESRAHRELKLYDDRLRQQIDDLEELDHDIKTFRVDAPKNKALQQVMERLAKLELSKFSE